MGLPLVKKEDGMEAYCYLSSPTPNPDWHSTDSSFYHVMKNNIIRLCLPYFFLTFQVLRNSSYFIQASLAQLCTLLISALSPLVLFCCSTHFSRTVKCAFLLKMSMPPSAL